MTLGNKKYTKFWFGDKTKMPISYLSVDKIVMLKWALK